MLPSRCAVRPLGRATVLCCCAALAESVAFDSVGREFDRKDDTIMFEHEPMEQLAREGQIMCWKHNGFWQCMDTLRDKEKLEKLWSTNNAPWKVWND